LLIDPVFFMDNSDPNADSPGAGAVYNLAPRISAFKGAHYTCEPVKRQNGRPAGRIVAEQAGKPLPT
jgi:hypothetical protein